MGEILLVLQFVLAITITIVVLLQKSSSIGLGVYSGSNESLFGAKGPASFLAKITFILGFVFVANTLALGYIYSQKSQQSVFDNIKEDSLVPEVPIGGSIPIQNKTLDAILGTDSNSSTTIPEVPVQTPDTTPQP
ncbi:preprotein translocase subunit SecG [Helicobacter monodelphidis]|uniref:preprotein translocase subunit SecG n=1 Tax=Helicobacter sp. 15-1451 TaxID=2004995 RepID=UPI000DCB55F0|nr:preprotein translocase subunit SecG [Helicobacter sp. 15-1451]RAX57629.1 preprotein translocase subunit SecG [Helicobacter sp. 15-1451]